MDDGGIEGANWSQDDKQLALSRTTSDLLSSKGLRSPTRQEREPQGEPNIVWISKDGPLNLRGQLKTDFDEATTVGQGRETKALAQTSKSLQLCRCGRSGDKPYCDGSHAGTGFQDSGAVGDSGEKLRTRGGLLSIRRHKGGKDGPLILSGNFTIVTGSGRVAWEGRKAVLCSCGESKNKPFCDGSHECGAKRRTTAASTDSTSS